jgi:rhodanese-related sulfurtransferase
VKVFAEGFPRWMKEKGNYAAVSVDWVQKQLEGDSEMVLVDSRPKRKKYDKGHIPGAVSIPDMYFDKEVGQLPEDKTLPVVFYCGGYKCKLSHKSAAKAVELGYTNVKVFAGGYPEWKQAYGAKMAAAAEPASSIKAGKEEGSIDVGEFKRLVQENPESLYVVDVRDPDEFAKGSLKTAVNIPVDKLMDRVSELPSDKPVVFICGTGARSGESYYMVQDMRPELKNVYYVEAEMTFATDGSFEIAEPKS